MEVNDVCVYDGALVGTADGAIVTYRNGELGFQPLQGEASALIPFKGKLMVAVNGSDGVRMLCYEGLGTLVDELLLPVEGRMTALTASENYCFGVTSEGEILRTGSLEAGAGWFCPESAGPSLRGVVKGYSGNAGQRNPFQLFMTPLRTNTSCFAPQGLCFMSPPALTATNGNR